MPDVVPNPPGIHFEKDENVKKLGLSGFQAVFDTIFFNFIIYY